MVRPIVEGGPPKPMGGGGSGQGYGGGVLIFVIRGSPDLCTMGSDIFTMGVWHSLTVGGGVDLAQPYQWGVWHSIISMSHSYK